MIEAEIISDDNELTAELDGRGDRGPIGKTPNLQIGIVETLDAGNKAFVTRDGTNENPIFNFGIPQGEKGDIGPIGKTGPSGVYKGETEPANPDVNVWIDPNGKTTKYAKKTDLDNLENKLNEKIASGELNGVGITKITNGQSEIQDDYTVTPIEFHKSDGTSSTVKVSAKNGTNGKDGVGITTITSGQSSVEDGKTITPVTVQKTDGSSQNFKVEAKNGLDGQNGQDGKDGVNGQDGLTPSIGENGNWFIGDTDTGKPSRGEVGPTPDLSDYVKNTDYANASKAGLIKSTNYLNVTSDGVAYASPLTKEIYESTNPNVFIGKGTLENIKDDYVGSSTPVQDLNNSLKDITPKQDAEGTDNTITDALDKQLFALSGDGESEQVVTTGKNLLKPMSFDNENISGIIFNTLDNGSIFLNGTSTDVIYRAIGKVNLKANTDYVLSVDSNMTANLQIYFNGTPTDAGANWIPIGNNHTVFRVNEDIQDAQINITIKNSTTVSKVFKIQLEENSVLTEYEPYTNGIPSPSPDYEQPINSIEGSLEFACNGRNLLPNNASSKTINGVTCTVKDDGSVIVNGTATARVNLFLFADNENPIKLIPGIYSLNSGKTIGGSFLQIEVKNSIGESRYITSSNTPNNNVVINEGDVLVAGYIGIDQAQTATNDHIYPVFKKGTTATSYEPYVEPNEVTFNLNEEKLRSVGNVKDELVVDLDTGDYYKVENVGEVVLDGSENWIFDTITSNTNIRQFHLFLNDKNVFYDTISNNIFVMSDYFKGVVWDSSWLKNNTITPYTDGVNRGFRLYSEKFEDVEQLKQWLSTNNTIVDYVLRTPTTKKLGTLSAEDLAKLKTFKGYNNVTVNTNLGLMNIRFTYCLDIKKYVDNKIAELSAQLIKGE